MNIKDTLVEVRKAYRLLYYYQRSVLDLVEYLSKRMGFIKYRGGFPIFSNPSPNRKSGKLKNWAWDWLNFYFYEFNFEENNGIRLSIFILSDTGYFDKNKDKVYYSDSQKKKVNEYESEENSKTKLIFAVGKWAGDKFWKAEPKFLSEEEGENIDEENRKMVYKHYYLEDFENEYSADEKLKDFQDYCRDKGITIKIKDKVN